MNGFEDWCLLDAEGKLVVRIGEERPAEGRRDDAGIACEREGGCTMESTCSDTMMNQYGFSHISIQVMCMYI